jgi:hypothetical protein
MRFFYFLIGLFILNVSGSPVLIAQHTASASGGELGELSGRIQRHAFKPSMVGNAMDIIDLIPGQTYHLTISSELYTSVCLPDIRVVGAGVEVLGVEKNLSRLRFKALGSRVRLELAYPCTWDEAMGFEQTVSLLCETCVKTKMKDLMQELDVITVAPGGVEELVKEVLIGGDCFDVTNIMLEGQGGQIGSFANGLTNVGFSTGMVMATGDISVVVGPNDQDNASGGYGIATPDGDLETLTNGSIFDRAGVEFDFSPTQSPITFEFVFGSEEYCEYVNSQFNDVFGFFISGPGIAGTQNLAVLPGGTPITINSVNHVTNAGFYVNNTPASGQLCGQAPSALASVNELQFDGYTRRITAVANVIPCQTYHMKLKVGDVGDGAFDSAVFLKAGSFDGGGNAAVDFVVNGDSEIDEVVEGCGTVTLIFDRVGGNLNVPLVVPFVISGTATNVLDYSGIPGTAIIPSGQDKLTLTINIVNDLLAEGDETIIITLNNPCSCTQPQEILIIKDRPDLDVVPDTTTICGQGVGTVGVEVVSGVEPYTYLWANGSTTPTISPYTAVSTNYRVTVTDACGLTQVETARIIVRPPPIAQLLPPAPQLCPGESGFLNVNFTGQPPFTLEYTLNGDPQTPIENITDDPFKLPINQPGLYIITAVYDSLGCKGAGQGAQLVVESVLNMTGVSTGTTCFGQANGSINTQVTGGQGPFNYTWEGPTAVGNFPDPTNLLAGTYFATVTDFFGCEQLDTFLVSQPSATQTNFNSIVGPNCSNPNGGSIDLTVSGGTPAYTYLWSNAATTQDITNLSVGTYTVTVTDNNNCTHTNAAVVVGNFTPPVAAASVSGLITCLTPSLVINGTASSAGPGILYNWTATPGNIVSGGTTSTPTVNQGGTYHLVVTNTTNGCTAAQSVTVDADLALPTAAAGPDQTLTCAITNITLDGSASSQGNNFTYQWTASGGGNILGGATSLNPIVNATGQYTLVVTNTANGCTRVDVAVVNNNITAPNASIAPPTLLTCQATTQVLNGLASTPAGALTYNWSTSNGLIVSGQNAAQPTIGEPGTYTLVVTNTANGCTHAASVVVNQDNSVPNAAAAVNGILNCNVNELTISGNGSSSGSNFTFNWATSPGGNFVSGQNTLNPVVNSPGTYTLIVKNTTNNCTASASILIDQNTQPPVANAGGAATLTCATTTLVLGDPNAPNTPNISYSWSGSGIVAGGNTPTPTINQPGTYNLFVKNNDNGCTATAAVAIPQNITAPLATVAAPAQLTCTTPAIQLNAGASSTGAGFSYAWGSASGGGIGSGVNTLTPTITAAGLYTLTVTNTTNGCTSTAAATVNSSANLPTAVAVPGGIITCTNTQVTINGGGSTTGASISYQWGTLGGSILSGQGTLQAVVGAPGQYTLLVTNSANNCTATFNVVVAADLAPPTVEAGNQSVLLCSQPTMNLNATGTSTGSQFTYQWSASSGGTILSGANTLQPVINTPGTYQLVTTNTQNGCTAFDQVVILADVNDPVVTIATPATLNCTTTQTILNGSASSNGSNFNYQWTGSGMVGASNGLNVVVNTPGTYTLMITNTTNGCTSVNQVEVDQDITLPPADAGADLVLNCTNPQLQLGGSANPSGNNFSFQWAGPGILTGANSPSPVINQGGTYNLTVTNTTNGCTRTDAAIIGTDFASPLANAGPGFELTCVNATYTMQASASTGSGFTYQWTTQNGNFVGATNVLTPTVDGAGIYTLLVTNQINGCTQSSAVTITQAADVPVAVSGTANLLTCANTTQVLNGAGSSGGNGIAYLWTASQGGNIVSGANTLTPTINAPGIYTLSVINTLNNCASNASITVLQNITPPDISAGPSPTLTCANTTVSLSGVLNTNVNATFQWSPPPGSTIVSGSNTLTPVINAGGLYTLTVTNQQNGCTSSASVVANVDQTPPNALINTPATLTCATLQTTLNTFGSSTGDMTYTWTTAGGNIVDASNPLAPVVNQPGTYTLLVLNNLNGCNQSATTLVNQDIIKPDAQAGSDGLLTCTVTALTLNGSGSSQNGNFFYQWTTNDGQILTGAYSLSPTIVAGGTYQLVVVNNDNGCSTTDATFVAVNTQTPTLQINNPPIITCTQPQVTIDAAGSQTGAGISYAWTTVNGQIVSGAATNQLTVGASGTYTFIVTNTGNGCTNTGTALVSDNIILPIADAGTPFTLTCTTQSVTLLGTGSAGSIYTYNWTTTDGQIVSGSNSLNPIVDETGTYHLTVINTSTGCKESDSVVVDRETDVPTGFDYTLEKPGCKDNDGNITFGQINGGYGPFLYSIDGGDSFVSNLDFSSITPGVYELMIQDVNGCEFTRTLTVPQAPDPGVDVTPILDLILGDSVSLQALLPAGYPAALIDTIIWTPTTGLHFEGTDWQSLLNPGVRPFVGTEYTVQIFSTDGCSATDRILIRVDNEPHIYIPNVLNPEDSDLNNDLVYIFADAEQVERIDRFQIFDRWGTLMFTAQNFQPNDPSFGWDGTYNKENLNPAVFVYYAEVLMIDGRKILFKGDITLVR